MTQFKPIRVTVCEDIAAGGRGFAPTPTAFHRIPIDDPFGLRKAIVPVFMSNEAGDLIGMGTSFFADEWGTLITADHVIDIVRMRQRLRVRDADGNFAFKIGTDDPNPYVLLGPGVAYGGPTFPLPEGALARVRSIRTPATEKDNPLAQMQGWIDVQATADLAVMRTAQEPEAKFRAALPIRLSGWRPNQNDWVVAIGFPDIEWKQIDEAAERRLLSEGLFAAYGRILTAHPQGRGNTLPTPVIEVEANWPPGMSGGPVINMDGEVIGLVSRGLHAQQADGPSMAWAACFELMPWLLEWLPTVDPINSRCRVGWAVRRLQPWHIAGFYETEAAAQKHASQLGADYAAVFGTKVIGTDDFMEGTSVIRV